MVQLAETSRLVFAAAGVDYEDHRRVAGSAEATRVGGGGGGGFRRGSGKRSDAPLATSDGLWLARTRRYPFDSACGADQRWNLFPDFAKSLALRRAHNCVHAVATKVFGHSADKEARAHGGHGAAKAAASDGGRGATAASPPLLSSGLLCSSPRPSLWLALSACCSRAAAASSVHDARAPVQRTRNVRLSLSAPPSFRSRPHPTNVPSRRATSRSTWAACRCCWWTARPRWASRRPSSASSPARRARSTAVLAPCPPLSLSLCLRALAHHPPVCPCAHTHTTQHAVRSVWQD